MIREVLKQMLPFILFMGLLWVVAELLERTMPGHQILPQPEPATAAP